MKYRVFKDTAWLKNNAAMVGDSFAYAAGGEWAGELGRVGAHRP